MKKVLKKIKIALSNVWKKIKKIRINKKVLYVLIGLLVVLFLVKACSPKQVSYPVIYEDADGDLYLMTTKTKSNDKAVKLATKGQAGKVKYANTTARYVLFQKEESLYLYDAKKKEETRKICNNVSSLNYFFTEDDKYVVVLDNNANLKVYNYKEATKIDSNVSRIKDVWIKGDYIIYEKDKNIYVRSIKPKKDDAKKVTTVNSSKINFTKDGKYITYINETNELHRYNIKKDKDDKISNNVSDYYCDSKSCEKIIYVMDEGTKSIYYYDGKKDVRLAEEVYQALKVNVDDKQVIYSKANGNKFNLYYQKGTKDPAKIDEGLDGISSDNVYVLGKEIYYKAGTKLKYAKISGARISRKLTVADNVSTSRLVEYKKGYVFTANIGDNLNGDLYVAKGGKAKKISENVFVSTEYIVTNKKGTRVYFIRDIDDEGALMYTKGGKPKLVDTKVLQYTYVKDNLIYIVKNYSSEKNSADLYRYTNKSVKIVSDVQNIASIDTQTNIYEGKSEFEGR